MKSFFISLTKLKMCVSITETKFVSVFQLLAIIFLI